MTYLDKQDLDTTDPREPNYGEEGDPCYDEYQQNWRNDPYYQEWLDAYIKTLPKYWPETEEEHNMKVSDLSDSKYLKKEDVMPAISVTIAGISRENLARDSEPPEMKFILNFKEAIKPMVLNPTNGALIEHILGDDEMDNWTGKTITLYNDPSVSYGGKLTGGIRVQIPQEKPEMRSEDPDDF